MNSVARLLECKAVIWDFDGTLAQRPDMWCNAIAEACRLAGATEIVPADFDGTAYLFLPWNTTGLSHPHAECPERWWQAFLADIRPLVVERVNTQVVDVETVLDTVRRLALDCDRYQIITQSVSAAMRLRARGIPQYILSNHVPELEGIVSQLFPGTFRKVWSSGRIGFEKPREEIFRYVLDRLPFDSETVLIVGDDHYRDLAPARALGMNVMHVSEVSQLL